MTIRDIKPEDFDATKTLFMQLQNLHVTHRPDLYCNINKPYINETYYKSLLEEPDKISLGAEIEEKVVGLCISDIRKTEGENFTPRIYLHIKNLIVDENYRKKGIGKALFNEAIKRAKIRGAETVDLKVFSFNTDAIEFYKSLGMSVQNLTLERQI